ncbi:MAG: PAS domain S-box protein, partial [Candidatus Thorarchaeota archaeon]
MKNKQHYILQQITDFDEIIRYLDSATVIQNAVDFFRDRFQIQKVSIAILEQEHNAFCVYAYSFSDQTDFAFRGKLIPKAKTYMSKVISTLKPHYRPDITQEEPTSLLDMDKVLIKAGIRSLLYIPLYYQKSPMGVLNLSSPLINAFSDENQELYIQLAARLSLSLQNALLHSQLQKSVQQFKISEARYKMLVEKLEEGVCLEDVSGHFSFVNPKACSLLGYTEEELNGMHWSLIVANEEHEKVALETANRPSGISNSYETVIVAKDGTNIPVIVTAAPVFSSIDGTFEGILSVFADIRARKEAEEALRLAKEKYQSLVESMYEGILLEDSEGIITFVNPRTCQMLGYFEEELLGKHWSMLVTQEEKEIFEHESSKRPLGESSTYNGHILTKSGQKLPIIITANPIFKNGTFDGTLSVFTDVTEIRRAEEQMKRLKLEEERYFSMMSHFQKNNLMKILANIELLTMDYVKHTRLDQEIIDQITEITKQSAQTIDKVTQIFEALRTPFQKDVNIRINILEATKDAFKTLNSQNLEICDEFHNNMKSDVFIYGDKYLGIVLLEILGFYSSGNFDLTDVKVHCAQNDYFSLIFKDKNTIPISEVISSKLMGGIT